MLNVTNKMIFLIYMAFTVIGAPLEFPFVKRSALNSLENNTESSILSFSEIPLINSRNDQMIVNLCLGTPKQCFNVVVDTGSFYLWVRDKYSPKIPPQKNNFDNKISSSFKNLQIYYKIVYGTGRVEGFKVEDVLTVSDLTAGRLKFILVNQEESGIDIDGILGLGNYYEDFEKDAVDYSLIDQLYNKKVIAKKMFTQKYTATGSGIMYVGELPGEIQGDLDNYGTCDTLKGEYRGYKNPRWECNLSGVFFGKDVDNAFILNQRANMDTGTNFIMGTKKFFDYLVNTLFKEYILHSKCLVSTDNINIQYIICNYPYDMGHINFVFGEHILRMDSLWFLDKAGLFRYVISSQNDENDWIIGEPLLKKFHVVYDRSSDKIGFYSKTNLFKMGQPLPEPVDIRFIIVIILICLLLLFTICYLAYFYWKSKQHARLQNPRPSAYARFGAYSDM